MYAVIESGGKQYRVEEGTVLTVDRLSAGEGEKVALRPVMVSGDKLITAAKDLEKVRIEATVTEHLRGEKIRVFKYKAKKGYSRRRGHRSELTRLEVTSLGGAGKAPAKKAAKKNDESAAEAKAESDLKTETEAAPKKQAAKAEAKAAPKKPAAKVEAKAETEAAPKKPAAKAETGAAPKKPAPKKPAPKKPAAEKPAAGKEETDGA